MLKTIAFIDAGQFRPAVVASRLQLPGDKRFDWERFKEFLQSICEGYLIDCHYFDSLEADSVERQIKFHSYLRNALGFQMHFLDLKEKLHHCPACNHIATEREQKGVDVGLTVQMMKLAYNGAFDHALLCSGDGDFAPVVEFVRDTMGKRVTVLGWSNGVAPYLREAACKTITLNDHFVKFIGDRN